MTTGKVQGRITDAMTGDPIARAMVRVDGTTLANISNEQGFYFLNEVPPGLQSIRAEVLGYQGSVLEDERILAGQTFTLNFELEQTAVELEPLMVMGERNPLVPRDQVSTKSIIQGETIDLMPVDNVSQMVVLQPGAYSVNCETTNELDDNAWRGQCLSIRGGRPNEEALYVDGVLVRSFGTGMAKNVSLPTNALAQVDVTVGGFAAEFGEAQSGVVSYVTRTGGARFTGSLEVATDRLGPETWTTNFNRLEANFGGPIAGPLTFFLAGSATGRSAADDEGGPGYWIQDNTDTCPSTPQFADLCTAGEPAIFTLPRGSSVEGATDSVAVAAPGFTLSKGRLQPYGWNDNYLFTGNINWQLPRGSRVAFGYTRNRYQWYVRTSDDIWSFYRADNMDGSLNTRDAFTLNTFLTLAQSPTQQVALDVRLSYQADRLKDGILDPDWYLSHQFPQFGFTFSDAKFHGDPNTLRQGLNLFDPGELELQAGRSGTVFADSTAMYPGRLEDLRSRQTVTGIGVNLRANPYGWYNYFNISGPGNSGHQVRNEDRLQARAALDWQLGRFNRLKLGGEFIDVDLSRSEMWLYRGVPTVNLASPRRIGAFLQNRLDVGDLVLEAGIRMDYLDPNMEYPRVPGFEGGNVPDSLQGGYIRWDSNLEEWVPKWDEPCGGVTDKNPNGTCLSNWIPATSKTEWSPRLGASFPVTPTSTFRLSYGRFVQTPAFFGGRAVYTNPTAAGQAGLWDAGQDVEMPSTRSFEFGYRQLIGQSFVIDASAFNKKQSQALTFRSLPYEDPNNPGYTVYQDVLTNLDFTESMGLEVRLDKAIGNLLVGNVAYTYLDARGTGWDPLTYVSLTSNANSNLAFQTGRPVDPPEVLLPLETARKHNFAVTGSLQLPPDYMAGTTVGAIFRDLGVFTILYARSGQRFTKIEQIGRVGLAPPSGGNLVESSFGGLTMPWQVEFDIRISKGFNLGRGWNAQAFVDWRNPFDLARTDFVFRETGDTSHELAKEIWVNDGMSDPRLDGDTDIRDFDIAAESHENSYNTFMLMRAEQRFGNGDGIYTVEEQTRAFAQDWEYFRGEQRLAPSNQSLRLGLRLAF
ncbi:MAG: TonB-dependent receptor [Gemmatimonadota bacterium]